MVLPEFFHASAHVQGGIEALVYSMIPSGATLINPNILFNSLLGFFVATNVATFYYTSIFFIVTLWVTFEVNCKFKNPLEGFAFQ